MFNRSFLLILFSVFIFSSTDIYAQDNATNSQKPISKGVVNGSAISLPKPTYPASALAIGVSGAVSVQVIINEEGIVESATAVSGHPLLRKSSIEAARQSKFKPFKLQGQPIKVSGVIVYNFVGEKGWMSIGKSIGLAEIKGISSPINLPSGFIDEQNQFNQLMKSSTEVQQNQLPNTIALIKAKLIQKDLWHFEFGLAKAKTLSGFESKNDDLIFEGLKEIKALSVNPPIGVKTYLRKISEKLSGYADKAELTDEDRKNIFQYIK